MRIKVKDRNDQRLQASKICDAAVMIGGGRGSLGLARRFIDAGKPVFPVPFTGRGSDDLFQELLKGWSDSPIPGLRRYQLLRLALPWTAGASDLMELLKGTLADHPEIFVSYRRSDTASAVGRLQRDLTDRFGNRRIFVDETRIEPSEVWRQSISNALEHCKVGLIVIGKQWMDARLSQESDTLRHEVAYLLQNKVVIPILVDNVGMPEAGELPVDLQRLPAIQARPITNATWDTVMNELIGTIEGILGRHLVASVKVS